MSNYRTSTIGVKCPHCGFVMPIPSYLGEYDWKNSKTYCATHDWHCVNCGEKHTIMVERNINDAEIVKTVKNE